MLKSKSRSRFARAASQAAAPVFESLDRRQLMSAVPISTDALIYTQNFNADTLPNGWIIKEVGTGAAANGQVAVGTGSANTGDTYLFGQSSADRALGTLLSGSNTPTFGVVFRNDTGQLITSATVNYNGEMWRLGQANRGPDRLDVGYQVVSGAEPTDPTVGAFTSVPNLTFNSPVTTGAVGALNGNVAPNRTENINSALPGLSWAPGSYLVLRWTDFNATGSDDGLAVDDVSLTVSGVSATGPGSLVLSTSTPTVNEDAGNVTFTVSRVGGSSGSVSADLLITPDALSDLGTPSATSFSFADGDTTPKTFTIPVIDDTKYEIAETYSLGLTNPQGSAGAPAVAGTTLTINDNDTPTFKESFESDPGTSYSLIGATGDYDTSPTYAYFGQFTVPEPAGSAATDRNYFSAGFDGTKAIEGQWTSNSAAGWGDDGANPLRTIEIPNINIANQSDITAYISLGARDRGYDWSSTNGIAIYATIDGGSKTLIGQFKYDQSASEANGGATKGNLRLDTNFDGVGDGPALSTGALKDFAFNIPGSGNSLTLDIELTTEADYQGYAVDNVRLGSVFNTTTPVLPAWVSPDSQATWQDGILTVTGPTTIISDTDGDAPVIQADGPAAVLTIAPTNGDKVIHLGSLSLTNGATASVNSVGPARSATNHLEITLSGIGLTITGASSLNLHDNDMVVQDTADASLVSNLIASGHLKSDADNFTTALGYAANDGSAFYQYSKFGPTQESVDANSVLVKFTAAGDANLDGRVDSDDVFYIDFNFGNNANSVWSSGDLNGDGRTDSDDVFFIDFNFGASGF